MLTPCTGSLESPTGFLVSLEGRRDCDICLTHQIVRHENVEFFKESHGLEMYLVPYQIEDGFRGYFVMLQFLACQAGLS